MPLGFVVNLVAYNLEYWPDETCERYVRYEGIMTAFGIEVVGLMMLIRLHALYYDKSRLVVVFVAFILLGETVANVYLLVHALAVPHWKVQDIVHSCSMIFGSVGAGSAASAWIPLLYDTIILLLTLHVTVPSIRRSERGFIVRTILKDGLRYYVVICAVTLVLTIMIAAAPDGLKNITAQLELLLTVTMMSRITIHLKKEFYSPSVAGHRYDEGAVNISFSRDRPNSVSTTRKRSRSYSDSSSASHADISIGFVRPPPVYISPIFPERRSEIRAAAHGTGHAMADVDEQIFARGSDQWRGHNHIQEQRRDLES